jgi:CrcB protein
MDRMLANVALVALGSAFGGVARYLVNIALTIRFGDRFPWGTLAANVSGSLLIGVLSGLALARGRTVMPPEAQLLLMTGFCGGYTTFSAFALQTLILTRDGMNGAALAYVGLSVVLCLLAVWAGAVLGRSL